MGAADIEGMVKTLESAGIDQELIEEITYCVDYEHTVTALEARLRGGYKFQEIITDTLTTTMKRLLILSGKGGTGKNHRIGGIGQTFLGRIALPRRLLRRGIEKL